MAWWNLELKDKTPEWAAKITGLPAEQIKPLALLLNTFVASVGCWNFLRAGHLPWRRLWPHPGIVERATSEDWPWLARRLWYQVRRPWT